MAESVSALLEQRTQAHLGGSLRGPLAAALVLHVVTPITLWLVPRWLSPPPPPPQYVTVQIVPAARLGIEKPKPAPEPPPEPPKPAPEPKPESKAPVLPKPEKKKAASPKPQPAPQKEPEPAPEAQGTPGGKSEGFALGATTAMLDNPDFTYGYYVDQMLAQISRNWVRPPVGSGIEATIHYRIERDGRIVEVEVARSSGIPSFDLAAVRAVQSSSPLPPLPRAFREESLGVNLIVR